MKQKKIIPDKIVIICVNIADYKKGGTTPAMKVKKLSFLLFKRGK